MNDMRNYLVPNVIVRTRDGERGYDIYSRLLEDRIIFLGEEVTEGSANTIVAQLLHLANEDPDKDIQLYINSPGGSVYDGLAIYDTMQYIKPDVQTIGIGLQASMGAFLLSSGAKGKRFVLPNARVFLAGAAPKDLLETYKEAGIDEYISVRANCYEVLESLQKKKGMIA